MTSTESMRKLGELTRVLDRADLMQPTYAAVNIATCPRQWRAFLRTPIFHANRKRDANLIAMIAEAEALDLPGQPNGSESLAFHFGLRGIQPATRGNLA
jgi:hypothetical protein